MANKDKKNAKADEQLAFKQAQEDRAKSRARADYMAGSQKERMASTFKLRDRSQKFLDDVAEGKDVKEMLKGELSFRDKAGERAEKQKQMFANTGSRALMGAPNANFQAQLDTQSDLASKEAYAGDALDLFDSRREESKVDAINSENSINNDEYNISNVLSGNASQGQSFWDTSSKRRETEENRQGWFSKYVMPFATAAAGGAMSAFTGGMMGGGGGAKSGGSSGFSGGGAFGGTKRW